MRTPQVSIIVPLYNESKTFPHLIKRLNDLIESNSKSIEVVLVDDGSRDNTPLMMKALALQNQHYQCIFLSRNHSHQLALTAGLFHARATECCFVIDGDLQDPPELLDTFYEYFEKGYDVVYAVRKKRKENFLKKAAYKIFYRILSKISYIKIPLDSGDFGLMGRNVVDIMNKMPEESRYLRGMRTWVGFKQIGVEYERSAREFDTAKYSFPKLLKLAYDGVFNFSEFPIKLIGRLGLLSIGIALIYFVSVLYKKFVYHTVPEGFTALLFGIIFFSGIQMIFMGILGEYILRIFFQVKNRPLFIVKERIVEGISVNEEPAKKAYDFKILRSGS